MSDEVKKRAAVCDAWDAYRKQPELLDKIQKLEQSNKILANLYNQASALKNSYRDRVMQFENRRWWQRLFS